LKSILILCGGTEAIAAVKTAKSMGLFVIVADADMSAPCKEFADLFIKASIYHPEEIIAELEINHKDLIIDGVITVAADNPLSVAKVSSYLGLESIKEKTAEIASNKTLMKKNLATLDINIPWYSEIDSKKDLKKIIKNRPGEYVLKPIDSRGSRGVIRISSYEACEKAFNYSINYSDSKKLILEEWITGDQLSSESIVVKGKTKLCGLADRNYSNINKTYPYVVEDGGETPSKYSSNYLFSKIDDVMNKIVKKINLINGSIKGDLILHNNKLYLIEFAVRLSGGFFSTITIPNVYGYNLVKNVIKLALGEKVNLPEGNLKPKLFQANRFLFLESGRVKKISGLPSQSEYIYDFNLSIKTDQKIFQTINHTLRYGSVMVMHNTRENAILLANKTISDLKIELY